MSVDKAAWRALGTPAPAEPQSATHRCTSCGRGCALCRDGQTCGKADWCNWCAEALSENPPKADGRVYCASCDAPFPTLPKLIEAGLRKYPRHCRACREARREDAAEDRNHYGTPPPATATRGTEEESGARPSTGATGRTVEPPKPTSAPGGTSGPRNGSEPTSGPRRPKEDPDALYLRGGFRPRSAPRPTPHGSAPGEPAEMTSGEAPPEATRAGAVDCT